MTEQELAKGYVDKLYAEKVNNKDFDKDGHILYQSKDISDAYLAGYNAALGEYDPFKEYFEKESEEIIDEKFEV
jgi:hypothetical protein